MKCDLSENICHDCGVHARNERYMVTDEIWRQGGLGPHYGVLCIGCLETATRAPANADGLHVDPDQCHRPVARQRATERPTQRLLDLPIRQRQSV